MASQDGHPPEACGSSQDVLLSIWLVTLFPGLFDSWLRQGVVSRAIDRGLVRVRMGDIRRHGIGKHRITDDYPFGGGAGMVMKPEPLFAAVEELELPPGTPTILLSPRGRPFRQAVARELAALPGFALVSGHYEGIDERVRAHLITDEISLGDYVISSGELAAMVVADAVVRLLPGTLSDASTVEESFSEGLLEYPQYTRPVSFRSWAVPDVLLSGHHAQIARWRREQRLLATLRARPDLLQSAELNAEDRAFLRKQADATDPDERSGAGRSGRTGRPTALDNAREGQ